MMRLFRALVAELIAYLDSLLHGCGDPGCNYCAPKGKRR